MQNRLWDHQHELGGADHDEAARTTAKSLGGPHELLSRLQRSAGNRAVAELLGVGQAKLAVGASHDRFELEADEIARSVVSFLDAGGRTRKRGDAGDPDHVDSDADREAHLAVDRDAGRAADRDAGRAATSSPASVRRVSEVGAEGGEVSAETEADIQRARRSGGVPMDRSTRTAMEDAFGTDFGAVRLHAGREASNLNERVQAKAFTVGNDVFFRDALPDSRSRQGKELLAHELAHTVQQGGARAVGRKIQRLPAAADLKAELGGPSLRSNTYRALLKALDQYEKAAARPVRTEMDFGPKIAQKVQSGAQLLDEFLDDVLVACDKYLAGHQKDKRAPRIQDLKRAATREREFVKSKVASFTTGGEVPPAGVTWREVVPNQAVSGVRNIKAEGGKATGNDKGGINEVTKFSFPSGEAGFFKAGKPKVDQFDNEGYKSMEYLITSDLGIPQGLKGPGEEGHEKDKVGPRFAERSVAVSRIDQLLNAGVIARTELAVTKGGDGQVQGQLMAAAKGQTIPKLDTEHRIGKDGQQPGPNGPVMDINDPNLQRLLSKLDVIDSLCGQYDRHAGNFFIDLDDQGKARSVTGIDNDLTFGTKGFNVGTGTKGGADSLNYEGVGQYVDIEIAEAVMKLTPGDLRLVLVDLLTEEEIQAAIERLTALQSILKERKDKGKLVKPGEWGKHTVSPQGQSQGYHARYAHLKY